MPSMTVYKFGDVVLVPFPFTDQTTSKKRPAIIVSSDEDNRQRPDLILMAVTSQIRPSATFGETAVSGWKQAGLLKQSVIKPIFTSVEKGLVLRKLGHISKKDTQALKDTLLVILG